MSERERQFSEQNADRYTLLVVYAIDLDSETHRIYRTDGSVVASEFGLVPVQWYGEIERQTPD